jgi:hypothetical protein
MTFLINTTIFKKIKKGRKEERKIKFTFFLIKMGRKIILGDHQGNFLCVFPKSFCAVFNECYLWHAKYPLLLVHQEKKLGEGKTELKCPSS